LKLHVEIWCAWCDHVDTPNAVRALVNAENRTLAREIGGGCMESPQMPRAWYFFSDDLPDGEVIVPFTTKTGSLAFGVRTGAMPDATLDALNEAGRVAFGVRAGAMPDATRDALNEAAQFVLGVGLAHLGHTEKPPD
jgi:hypothetical protein